VGRFIQQDPEGDGSNWYVYVENNPLVWIDPEGETRRKAGGYIFDHYPGDPGNRVHGGPHWHVRRGSKDVGRVGVRDGILCWVDKAKNSRVTGRVLKAARGAGIVSGVIAAASIGTAYAADAADPCGSANGYARTARAIGGAAGAFGGGWAGATLGATIGAFGGPIGAVAGGVVGGVIGGIGGGVAGEEVADLVRRWF